MTPVRRFAVLTTLAATVPLSIARADDVEEKFKAAPLDSDPWGLKAELEQNLPQKKAAMEKLRQKLVGDAKKAAGSPAETAAAKEFFAKLDDQGRFTDLTADAPARWIKALDRLNTMAPNFARMSAGEQSQHRDKLFKAVTYYCRDMQKNPDPFTATAFTGPRQASQIYFSLYDQFAGGKHAEVADALRDSLFMCWYYPVRGEGGISRKEHPYRVDVFRGTGAFIVGNLTYRPLVQCAVALDDTKLLDTFHKALVLSLDKVTTYQTMYDAFWGQEGMTPDGNGFSHGRQSYIFGYVRHWLRGAASNARLLEGTPWSVPTDKWDLPAGMILDGEQWYVYRGDLDWSVYGRHNAYPGPLDSGNNILREDIGDVLSASKGALGRADELKSALARINDAREFNGNRYWWNAEDMVQRRDNYYIGVNLSSVRSTGPEAAKPWSNVNYYFPYGSMMIKVTGDEYRRARGALDYTRLPGITSDPTSPLITKDNWAGYGSQSDFCGGVSDGTNGVAGMIFTHKDLPVTGRKGYFTFDGGVVCLGAGLTTGKTETTVNQTEWRGEVLVGNATGGTDVVNAKADRNLSGGKVSWLYHDRVGYLLLPTKDNAAPKLTLDQRPTRWTEIAEVNKTKVGSEVVTVPIFQLALPHPAGADTYAYAVLPEASPTTLAAYAKTLPFKVLANVPAKQAVQFEKSGVIQAVFYSANTITAGDLTITVDRPAVLMLTPSGRSWTLLVADPVQKVPAGQINVTLSGRFAGTGVRSEGGNSTVAVPLPGVPLVGKAAEIRLTAE